MRREGAQRAQRGAQHEQVLRDRLERARLVGAQVAAQPLVHPLEHVRRGRVERRARVRRGRRRAVAPAAVAAAPAVAVLGADVLDERAHGEEHAVRGRVARRGELHELRQHRRPTRRPLSSRDADEQHRQLLTHHVGLLRQRQQPVPCDAEQRASELELRFRRQLLPLRLKDALHRVQPEVAREEWLRGVDQRQDLGQAGRRGGLVLLAEDVRGVASCRRRGWVVQGAESVGKRAHLRAAQALERPRSWK